MTGRHLARRALGVRRTARGRRGERGAALVEFALVLPVLMGLAIGVAEAGMAWRASVIVATAARAGARTGATAGSAVTADHDILASVGTSLSASTSLRVNQVVIYRSDDADGQVPPACLTPAVIAAGGDSASHCNVYGRAEVEAVTANPNGTAAGYSNPACLGQLDHFWCPSTRNTTQLDASPTDFIGVYVEAAYNGGSRVFIKRLSLDDQATMGIEPGANVGENDLGGADPDAG
jgi:hypothetical protein